MSLYEWELRTTLTLRHRKGGGWYFTFPSEYVKKLKAMPESLIEIAVLKVMPPPVNEE